MPEITNAPALRPRHARYDFTAYASILDRIRYRLKNQDKKQCEKLGGLLFFFFVFFLS